MTGLAIKLFLGGLLKRLLGLFRWLVEHPLHAALIVAVVASLWLWRGKQHALAERDLAREEIAALINASKANAAALEKQRKDEQARYDNLARTADHDHAQALAAADSLTAAYIRSHRMRAVEGGVSAAPAITQGDGAGVSAVAPASAIVVSESDINACSASYAYALSAYEWALSLAD